MKKFQLKKVLLVLAFSILAVFLSASIASAASYGASLQKISQAPEAPSITFKESQADSAAYIGYTSAAVQTAATTTSITAQWNPVSNASRYYIYIADYGSNNFRYLGYVSSPAVKIGNLKAGKVYLVRIVSANSYEISDYYRQIGCATLYKSASVKSTSVSGKKYTFNMKVPTVSNSITGYRVSCYNYKTKKTTTKDYNSVYGFSLSLGQGAFYKVTIRPYLTLSGKKFVSPSGSTKYIALQPDLKKAGNTSSSMTVRWNKVYGATSYTIYVKYPGSSKYQNVGTTTATSARLNNMKIGKTYYMKVIANKKVGSTTWKTKGNYYYSLRLYRS